MPPDSKEAPFFESGGKRNRYGQRISAAFVQGFEPAISHFTSAPRTVLASAGEFGWRWPFYPRESAEGRSRDVGLAVGVGPVEDRPLCQSPALEPMPSLAKNAKFAKREELRDARPERR